MLKIAITELRLTAKRRNIDRYRNLIVKQLKNPHPPCQPTLPRPIKYTSTSPLVDMDNFEKSEMAKQTLKEAHITAYLKTKK